MNDKELCETFGTTLEEVEADAEKYEKDDLSGMTFSTPIDGRPQAQTTTTDGDSRKHARKTTLTIRMDPEVEERYSRLAKNTGRTRTYYLNKALEDSIDQLEYEYGILKDIEDYRAGRLETYSIDEVREHCGLAN